MNFIKKFFTKEKKNTDIKNVFPKKTPLTKKIFKYILLFLITIFFLFSILIYSFLWDFKKFFFNIPEITWFFWEKNYLVLMLNNSEIRPWWWFISSFAEVKFFMWIPKIDIKNSYDIWNPNPLIEPPYPYNKLLWQDIENYKWRVFRDWNLSPDFEINSKKIIELYNKSINNKNNPENISKKYKNIDWVFSVDMNFLESLLKVSWEIEVNWKKFDENNFFYQTQILSKDFDLHSIEDLNNRKNFLKPLINKIFSKISKKIFTWNINIFEKFLNEIKILANTKHIQIFFTDKNLEKKVENSWWDWKFSPKWEDFISVNVSNIWWRKADRYIRKNYFYDIDFTWKDAIWTLKIISKHLWTKSLISDFYQSYYKIYLPKWVEILETKANFKDKIRITQWENNNLNSTIIWWIINLQPWEQTEISIKYKLPKIVNSNNYNLNLITQAWWNWENWNVSVREKTDNILKSDQFETKENIAFFDWKIFSDKLLSLKNYWDHTQPIIVWQKFIKKDLIEINFSEKISDNFLKNAENFSIKNKNFPNQKINISKKYIIWNNLYLKLSSETWNFKYKKWDFYEIFIKDIYDLNWNYTSKNPVKITVIQH